VGATITNAGSPPSDALRAHYDEMARKFAAQPTGNYTVQFELVCESASLTTAVKQGGTNIWFVPFSYRGRPCYRVFWGHYATQAEATAAKGSIPATLRGSAAAVVVSIPKGSE
jgi:septal ring-binding cell division protein DamX